jgi:hypothetical protein
MNNRAFFLTIVVFAVFLSVIAANRAEAAWTITVTAPANTVCYIGEPMTITWTNQGYAGQQVAISLQRVSSSSSQYPPHPIANAAQNTGSFSWAIPANVSEGRYKVKVTGIGTGNPSDYGDVFEIKSRTNIYRKLKVKRLPLNP